MKKALSSVLAVVLLLLVNPVRADRGPVVWHEGVELRQDSQKAIILHNGVEEVLILGTELKASKEIEVLEFIPFPAEPKVEAAKGKPFDEVTRLIREKGLVFRFDSMDVSKGGRGGDGPAWAPVEIRFSEKIGIHDVTAIKINDIGEFSQWLERFFKGKGIRYDKEKLSAVHANARDYLRRGYAYFVFDSVKVSEKLRFIEPLVYRFTTEKIYYPLKTSNLIGGSGSVELILMLPGSVSDDLWNVTPDILVLGPGREFRLSTSSKLSREDVAAIYGPQPFFGASARVYLQVFTYRGAYDFRDDFTYDVKKLLPYAYRPFRYHPIPDMAGFEPPLSKGELRDYQEAFCLQNDPTKDRVYVDRAALQCAGFIPNDEYEVYAALFGKRGLSGIPAGNVALEADTTRFQYKGKNIDTSIQEEIVKDFNGKNMASYRLDEDAFPRDGNLKITLRTGKERPSPFMQGWTWVSRAGFNKERTKAVVYVSHASGPRSGVGYFVTLEKQQGQWAITGSHIAMMY